MVITELFLIVTKGSITVQIRNTITIEPDRVASVFSLGPRMMINLDALRQSGLIQPGSQLRYHYKLTLPKSTNSSKKYMKSDFRSSTTSEATVVALITILSITKRPKTKE
mgnify:CR=1 FL=1